MGPCDLQHIFSGMTQSFDENLLVGFDTSDDGGVYLINEDLATVQTADFITPVVDDPYLYGQIAAANSLSDIFAMGARVNTALNLVMFDSCHFSKEVMNEILKGGLSKIQECGGLLIGGHTIEDTQMKYGLSVLGTAHPKDIKRNNTGKVGDVLILTKPLGIGVMTTAIKADLLSAIGIQKATHTMAMLNQKGSLLALKYQASAMTDVTGFGFLGHLSEMLNPHISFEIDSSAIYVFEEALELASMGIIPEGTYRNRDFLYEKVDIKDGLSEDLKILLFDAQTSGGLLIAVDKNKSKDCLDELIQSGYEASIIGEVVSKKEKGIYVF